MKRMYINRNNMMTDDRRLQCEKIDCRRRRTGSGRMFGVLTVLLVFIIAFCTGRIVMSREKDDAGRHNHYYAALEQEYTDRTKEILAQQGLADCGINIRWVADSDGSREYTVLLNHRRLRRMAAEDKAALKDMLSKAEFADGSCRFTYVIG